MTSSFCVVTNITYINIMLLVNKTFFKLQNNIRVYDQ